MSSRTALAADAGVKAHDPGPGHPEQIARFVSVLNGLESAGLKARLHQLPSRAATDSELALAHTPRYIDLVRREVSQRRTQLSTGDTEINAHSEAAARLATGSVLSAIDAVFSGEASNAFSVVRPPGHHASADRGMGFCLFNSVAIAARYARSKYGAERIAIVDWDVHHGNGTQDIFYEDGSVLFFSSHQSPWYPGTGARSERGEGAGEGLIINCPFPAGSGREEILGSVHEVLVPALHEFNPDLMLISAGFDSRLGDPLGHFRLTDQDFEDLTFTILDLADQHCDGRLVSVLEGGYNLAGLAAATQAHVRALLGEKQADR